MGQWSSWWPSKETKPGFERSLVRPVIDYITAVLTVHTNYGAPITLGTVCPVPLVMSQQTSWSPEDGSCTIHNWYFESAQYTEWWYDVCIQWTESFSYKARTDQCILIQETKWLKPSDFLVLQPSVGMLQMILKAALHIWGRIICWQLKWPAKHVARWWQSLQRVVSVTRRRGIVVIAVKPLQSARDPFLRYSIVPLAPSHLENKNTSSGQFYLKIYVDGEITRGCIYSFILGQQIETVRLHDFGVYVCRWYSTIPSGENGSKCVTGHHPIRVWQTEETV